MIITTSDDDFLYERIIKLLQEVKLVRGGTDLAYTLRNHKLIKQYLTEKQKAEIRYIENTYFDERDNLNTLAIQSHHKTLQK